MKHFWYEYGDAIKGLVMLIAVIAAMVLFLWAMLDNEAELNNKKEYCYSKGYSEYKEDYCFRLVDGNTETLHVGDISW